MALQSTRTTHPGAMRLAMTLAVIAALAYLLIAAGMLGVGNLKVAQEGGAIVYVAAGCYLLGGLLILVQRRWLWIIGALINLLVMLFFFRMYQDRPDVLFSPGGLISKAAQLFLEVVLLYLILGDWREARHPTGKSAQVSQIKSQNAGKGGLVISNRNKKGRKH